MDASSEAAPRHAHRGVPALAAGAAGHVVMRGHRAVVCLHGEIDIGTETVLDAALAEAERTGAAHVLVDLTRVSFMDSGGLELVLDHGRALASSGRSLGVCGARRSVRRLLELAGSSDLLAEPA